MSQTNEKLSTHNPFEFITLLRGVAVLLVAWGHLVGQWLAQNNIGWVPLNIIREYVTQPLGIIQDFGFFSVVLIFLTSGFLITHVSQKENRKEFSIKRLLKIYPPLIISIIILVSFYWLYSTLTHSHTFIQDLDLQTIFLSMFLLNYFTSSLTIVNGIAWVLAVEGIFYIACLLLLPFLRNKPKTSITILLTFSALIVALPNQFGPNYYYFAVFTSFIPYLITGQIVYYFFKQRISKLQFAIFSITTFLVILGIITLRPENLGFTNLHILSFLYAYIIFMITLFLTKRIHTGRVLGFYSKISYSFYLNNTVSFLFITILFPFIGYELSLGTAFILLTLLAYILWRFVEQPSRRLVTKILQNSQKQISQSINKA